MERSFIAITAIASTLIFAGVWKATEPTSIPALAVVDTKALPDTAVAAPALRRHVATPARVVDAEPYNVVRPAYGASPPARPSTSSQSESSVFYSGCREVRAAGAAPLHRGQPGYRSGMDGDGDGIACEDYS